MEKVRITAYDVEDAWLNWYAYFKPQAHVDAFMDFIDPVRQTDVRYMYDNPDCSTLVFEHIARRLQLLGSTHYVAVLKANWDRVEQAHTSWDKRLPWK